MNNLKLGIFGIGHLGKIHLRCALACKGIDVIGFYEPNDEQAEKISAEFGVKRYRHAKQLIAVVDAIDIVTPTPTHYLLAAAAIKAGKHVFIEKPVTEKLADAKKLIQLEKKYNVKVQVGHVERFNPAFLALDNIKLDPRFVEIHRLAMFQPRGTDVSVVLDLMIHDLDLVLHLIPSKVKNVHANGVSVLSNSADIANVRIEFDNGAVANLTASRISLKQMRKVRLFQSDAYISMDFLEKEAQIVRMYENAKDADDIQQLMDMDTPKGKRYISMQMPKIEPVNAIKMELEKFAEAIRLNKPPMVTLEDGYKALELADIILRKIAKSS